MIEKPDGPNPTEPDRYAVQRQLIWKVLFLASSDPNTLMYEGVTAIQNIQERLANQIRNTLDGLPDYQLAITLGHGGQPFAISTNGEGPNQESSPDAQPGLALDMSSVYEADDERPIWSLKITVSIRLIGDIPSIQERLNVVLGALPGIVADTAGLDYVNEVRNRVTGAITTGTVSGSDRAGRASNGNTWGGGGSGSWPVPLNNIDNSAAPYRFQFYPPTGANPLDGLTGENVKVIILDTCPSQNLWDAAVAKYVTNQPVANQHPILRRLSQREGNGFYMYRKGHPAAITDSEELMLSDLRSEYGFPAHLSVDHGIFIAGIIDTIAPDAEIHLVQVMDDYGMLLYNTVDNAIGKMLADWKTNGDRDAVIINLSLNLQLSESEEQLPRSTKLDYEVDFVYHKRSRIQAQNNEALLIAAAGNEARYTSRPDGSKPPYPRPPASYEAVLGVSALHHDEGRAQYANWADDFDLPPEKEANNDPNIVPRRGMATFGGDILPIDYIDAAGHHSYRAVTHPEHGMLGLYLSDHFEADFEGIMTVSAVSEKGWARWAGTSFATPIFSGLAALIASKLYDTGTATPGSADDVVTEMLTYCDGRLQDIINGVSTDVEHILRVEQTT